MVSAPLPQEDKDGARMEGIALSRIGSYVENICVYATEQNSYQPRRISEIRWERRGSATTKVDLSEVMHGARQATEQEHQMSLLKALRTYPKAVGWSILASTALVMEGYDIVVRV